MFCLIAPQVVLSRRSGGHRAPFPAHGNETGDVDPGPAVSEERAEDVADDDPPPDTSLAEVHDDRKDVGEDHDGTEVPEELDGKGEETLSRFRQWQRFD